MSSEDRSLSERTIQGGAWSTALNVGDRVFQVARLLVLARLLAPTDFGLMGIGLVVITTIQQFTKFGLDEALIYHKESNIDRYLDTAFVVNAFRGAIMGTTVFVAAPFIASFFGEPRAEAVIQVLAATVLIRGLHNPAVIYFRKNIEFDRQFIYEIGGTVVDVVVSVTAAVILQSVWALVFGLLARDITRSLLSYLLHDYRPSLRFDSSKALELFEYGRWVMSAGVLAFLITQGDDVFVGKFLGATALGYYQLSYRISNLPTTEISNTLTQVSFPAFSQIQESDRLARYYQRVLQLTTVAAFPLGAGIALVAPPFVREVLGTQWEEAISIIQLLCVYGIARAVSSLNGTLANAIGAPHINTKKMVLKLLLLLVLIFPLSDRHGLVGVALAVIVPLALTELYHVYKLNRLVQFNLPRTMLRVLAIPTIGVALMAGAVHVAVSVTHGGLPELIAGIVVGAVMYPFVVLVMDTIGNGSITANVRHVLTTLR